MYLWEKMAEYQQEKYLAEAEMARLAAQLSDNQPEFRPRLAALVGDFLITCGLRLKGQYPRVQRRVYSSHN
ncbi:MAG: hypothetical protein KDJ65_02935 [Anaerolineae bacterium]|nr:hypothetical protein [Anaerolineae bacterium]